MNLLSRLIVVSLVACGSVFAEETPSENTKRASELTLAKIRFNESTLREVVDFLRIHTNRENKEVNIIIITPEDPAVARGGGLLLPEAGAKPAPRITLQLEGASVLDILREAAAQVDCEVQMEPAALIVRKKGAPRIPPLDVPPGQDVVRRRLGAMIIPRVEIVDSTVREAVQFIILKSKQLDPDGGIGMVLKLDNVGQGNVPAPAPAIGGIPGIDPVDKPAVLAPPVANSISRITLQASNISVLDLYRYIAASAGLDVWVDLRVYMGRRNKK